MGIQTHFVIVSDAAGNSKRAPMKTWLRENRDVLQGVDPTLTTSHQLRAMLRQLGWQQKDTGEHILLIQPSVNDVESESLVQASQAEAFASDTEQDEELAFALEHQLRDFLIANLPNIPVNGKKLRLFEDESGRTGREYPTGVGFIDILAQDSDGDLYVFELKRGRTSDHTVGQILRYMGWCVNRLALGRQVHGVIVAPSHDDRTKFAATVVPGLMIFEYTVEFKLRLSTISVP